MSTPKPYSCRLSQSDQEKIENAVEETGLSLSEILRRSFHHYTRTNPDQLSTFGESYQVQEAERESRPSEHSIGSQDSSQDVSTDPRSERKIEELDEAGSEDPFKGGIYQPTKE